MLLSNVHLRLSFVGQPVALVGDRIPGIGGGIAVAGYFVSPISDDLSFIGLPRRFPSGPHDPVTSCESLRPRPSRLPPLAKQVVGIFHPVTPEPTSGGSRSKPAAKGQPFGPRGPVTRWPPILPHGQPPGRRTGCDTAPRRGRSRPGGSRGSRVRRCARRRSRAARRPRGRWKGDARLPATCARSRSGAVRAGLPPPTRSRGGRLPHPKPRCPAP